MNQHCISDFRIYRIAAWVLVLSFGFAFGAARAETLKGYVLGVSDGATIIVLGARHQHLRVRIAGIDAPERGQAFFRQSQENLNKLVRRKDVVVEWHKKDRYGRLLGTVFVRGQDVGLEQVRAGLAWRYRGYATEEPPDERGLYDAAEKAARERKLGLWADPAPIPPWQWRDERFPPGDAKRLIVYQPHLP